MKKVIFVSTIALISLLFPDATLNPAGTVFGQQKKKPECYQSNAGDRNWATMADDYIFFDYVVCPVGVDPSHPLVRVWLTVAGDGFALEKWSEARGGADSVSVFHGKKKVFTLYRDLAAVPLKVFKAERRSAVPADIAGRPFLLDGSSLVLFENLTAESAERVRKAFEGADTLIKKAEVKAELLRDTELMLTIVTALDDPLRQQK